MTQEKKPFEYENIPDFAMRPARPAEDDIDRLNQGEEDQFDPSAYDRILGGLDSQDSIPKPGEETQQPEVAPPTLGEDVQPVVAPAQEERPPISPEEGETQPVSLSPEEEEAQPVLAPSDEKTVPITEQPKEEESAPPVFSPAIDEEKEDIAAIPVGRPLPSNDPTSVDAPSKAPPVKVIPLLGSLVTSKLKLTDIKDKTKTRVSLEEDILVPDVKPDLSAILVIDGRPKVSENEITVSQNGADHVKVSGDLAVEIVYLPEEGRDKETVVSIESKMPFRSECSVGASPNSKLVVMPEVESLDYTIINERKVRVKAVITLALKEYGRLDIELFEGVKGEEVQMLKEKIRVTDVALRKNQMMELKEELALKESMPEIEKILKYDLHVVESHKQITKEKAVINAAVYCNIMYLGKTEAETGKASENELELQRDPVLYQGKTEFTQFIKLADDFDADNKSLAGSRVDFNVNSFSVTKKEEEDGKQASFALEANIDTALELYKNIEKEIVTDVYHNVKDIQYETEELGLMSLAGNGASELSVREIINVPEKYGAIEKVVYMSGELRENTSTVEEGRSVIEGIATIHLICISSDEKTTLFNLSQEIPFRSTIDIPGAKVGMRSSNQLAMKDLWFDKINNRQIEVNAGVAVATTVSNEEKHRLIKNVSFIETSEDRKEMPSIVLYITRDGDNIWKIAKKYRTTIDEIKKINDLEYASEMKANTKLLIVTKNH